MSTNNARHEHYDSAFFTRQAKDSLKSARIIVPLVLEIISPKTVVDVGCGVGAWLRAFSEAGVEDIVGYDGEYINASQLLIPADKYCKVDLCRPLPITRVYDLAVCLEVVEHLSPGRSVDYVRTLTSLAPIVLFSAAIPQQGGTNHINEQWPWHWKELFALQGYTRIDAIRPQIWRRKDIEWYYRQNIVLYIRNDVLETHESLMNIKKMYIDNDMEIIGEIALRRLANPSLRFLLAQMPKATWRTFARKFGLKSD